MMGLLWALGFGVGALALGVLLSKIIERRNAKTDGCRTDSGMVGG